MYLYSITMNIQHSIIMIYPYIHECTTDASGIFGGIFLIVIFYTMTFFEQSFTFLHGSVSKLWFLIVTD